MKALEKRLEWIIQVGGGDGVTPETRIELMIEHAKEAMKLLAVEPTECEWEKNDAGAIDEWLTGCFQGLRIGSLDLESSGYVFCPYCGRKLRKKKKRALKGE